jgi:S-(hydroxymethyl)glutathione dehydrogenase/alcohol dehydrogenase
MTVTGLSMGTNFEAAVLVEIDRPLEIMNLTIFDPLSEGQLLIQLHSAGVCGSQLLEIRGAKGNSKFIPHLMGHEGYGEVVEVGPGVNKVNVGDMVVLHWRRSSGHEADSPKYLNSSGVKVGAGKVATFAELSVVSENRVTKVAGSLDPRLASLMGCGLSTGMSAVKKQAKVSPGDSVMVLGSGGIGLSVCLAANALGAKRIVAVDKDKSKWDLANGCGATEFLTSLEVLGDPEVLNRIRGDFDAVFETTGALEMSRIALSLAKDGGTVVQLGQSDPSTQLEIGDQGPAFGTVEGKTLVFSQGGGFNPDEDLPGFVDLVLETKRASWESLLGPTNRLVNVNLLIEGLRRGAPGRAMITF